MTNSIDTKISEIATSIRKSGDVTGLAAMVAHTPTRSGELVRRAAALGAGIITAFEFVEDFSSREIAALEEFISSGFRPLGVAA